MIDPSPNTNNIKALALLHKAMLTGQLLFGVLAFYLSYSNIFLPTFQEQEKMLQVIAIIFSATGIIAGNAIFKKRVGFIRVLKTSAQLKFSAYRTACIIQWALVEGPCLFSIICFMLVGNYAFLALAAALILYFTILAPVRMKIALQLKLSDRGK